MIVLSILGVAFAAFVAWLSIRIINRHEKWAKRTALGIAIASPFLYVASFGPLCWIIAADGRHRAELPNLYLPISWAMMRSDWISDALHNYALFGMQRNTRIMIPIEDGEFFPIAKL
jgi:hypothetical protein